MDVRLVPTTDGGEIELAGGDFVRDEGLETAVFLSLFGGNERDRGLAADESAQWWGNLTEPNPARRYRSETQSALLALPLSPATLPQINEAVKRDLAWMVEESIVRSAAARVTIPALDTVLIRIAFDVDGKRRLVIELTKKVMTG